MLPIVASPARAPACRSAAPARRTHETPRCETFADPVVEVPRHGPARIARRSGGHGWMHPAPLSASSGDAQSSALRDGPTLTKASLGFNRTLRNAVCNLFNINMHQELDSVSWNSATTFGYCFRCDALQSCVGHDVQIRPAARNTLIRKDRLGMRASLNPASPVSAS